MIADRRRELGKLERNRSRFQRKLDAVERRITIIGGGPERRGGRGGQVRNELTLPDAIASVLSRAGGAVAVGDIAEKVQAEGYRSQSANFRGIVNQALIKDKRFVAEERGMYSLRRAAKSNGSVRGQRKGRRGPGPASTKEEASSVAKA
jgi:hypothetical protein